MKTLTVLQHVESDYLGLIEDHLEARNIRFRYARPFVSGGSVPTEADDGGLIVLGAGPLGIVSGPLVPSLAPELRLITAYLERDLPVVGIGLGALMVAVAAGGGAAEAPLRFEIGDAHAVAPDALAGRLPDPLPYALYLRDRPVLPDGTEVLARDIVGEAMVFRIGTALGFVGHPGIKSAMVEDLVMEFEETPTNLTPALVELRRRQGEIAEALSSLMVGLVHETGWMSSAAG